MDEVTRVILGLDQVFQLLDFDLRYHEKFGFINMSISFFTMGRGRKSGCGSSQVDESFRPQVRFGSAP